VSGVSKKQVSAQPLATEASCLINEKTSLELEKKLKYIVGSRQREMNSIGLIPLSWLEATPT
jgi:hypothetical protein